MALACNNSPAVFVCVQHTFLCLRELDSNDNLPAVCKARPRACTDSDLLYWSRGCDCNVDGNDSSETSTHADEDSTMSGASTPRDHRFFSSIGNWADASESEDEYEPASSAILVPPPGQWDVSTQKCTELVKKPTPLTAGNLQAPDANLKCKDERTTLLVEGLPKNLTRVAFVDFLASEGLLVDCDFVYVPIDFVQQCASGYALVNVSNPDVVPALWAAFGTDGSFASKMGAAGQVSWHSSCQGLPALVEKFRNSQLMHKSVDDASKPITLQQGFRVPFPPPTKTLRPPRPSARAK